MYTFQKGDLLIVWGSILADNTWNVAVVSVVISTIAVISIVIYAIASVAIVIHAIPTITIHHSWVINVWVNISAKTPSNVRIGLADGTGFGSGRSGCGNGSGECDDKTCCFHDCSFEYYWNGLVCFRESCGMNRLMAFPLLILKSNQLDFCK